MTCLVAIGGHTGTGKTTLAYGLQRTVNVLKKAIIVEDDQVRRELLRVDLRHTLCDEDYATSVSSAVVDEIKKRTMEALLHDIPVINASGFFAESSRQAVQKLAEGLHKKFIGLWLVAPVDVMKLRIAKRIRERQSLQQLTLEQGHASDADEAVIDKFGDIGSPESPQWNIMDASIPAQELLTTAAACISRSK